MEDLPERIDSKFRYVLLSAARAEQMIRAGVPRPEGKAHKVTRVAMNEIGDGAIEWDYGPAPDPVSEERDSEEAAAGAGSADGAEG